MSAESESVRKRRIAYIDELANRALAGWTLLNVECPHHSAGPFVPEIRKLKN